MLVGAQPRVGMKPGTMGQNESLDIIQNLVPVISFFFLKWDRIRRKKKKLCSKVFLKSGEHLAPE